MLKKAFYMNDNQSPFLKRPDYVVCTCMEVMYSQIIEAIKEGENTFDKLSERLGVGTGCSSCVDEVCTILAEERS